MNDVVGPNAEIFIYFFSKWDGSLGLKHGLRRFAY